MNNEELEISKPVGGIVHFEARMPFEVDGVTYDRQRCLPRLMFDLLSDETSEIIINSDHATWPEPRWAHDLSRFGDSI